MADITSTGNEVTFVPTTAKSFNEYYNDYGREKYGASNWKEMDPDHWFTKVGNFFTGDIDTARSKYEAYLTNLQNENELKATQSARAWDKYLSDTQYQRSVEDMKKAGLNPWLGLQSGVSASSVPSSAKANYKTHKAGDNPDSKKDRTKDLALLLLAIAKMTV